MPRRAEARCGSSKAGAALARCRGLALSGAAVPRPGMRRIGMRRIANRLGTAADWGSLAVSMLSPPAMRQAAAWRHRATRLERRDAVLIQPSGIVNRGRVLRIAGTLVEAGWSVAFFAKLPARRRTRSVAIGRALDCPIFYFPDAHAFLGPGTVRVPALNWPLMIQYLNARMWTYIRALRPRVVHTFGVAAIGLGHDLCTRLRAEGHDVFWCHDFLERTAGHVFHDDRSADPAPDPEWRRIMVALEAAHAHHPDHSFTVSPALAAALVEDYGLASAPTVLLNAPRRRDFDATMRPTLRQRLRIGAEAPLIVYVGGVTPLRGIEVLVRALARLPAAHLALVVDAKTPYLVSLVEAARGAGCGGRLHLLPYVAPDRISSFVRDATVGVHPLSRYGNAEVALPNKLFDYLHAGLPVVVSDCRAMADFVRTHEVGRVFAAGDAGSLAAALRRIFAEGATMRPKIEAARRQFCWECEESSLLEVYRRGFEMLGPGGVDRRGSALAGRR
jgi:glycosyltransferase involved in cell wall biosynthesis